MGKFITLTHLATNRPTNIDVDTITCVRQSWDGKTLVLFGKNEGQYVAEESQLVVNTVESMREEGKFNVKNNSSIRFKFN